MDLSHSFTVPTSVEGTWAHFQDIGALAECFPGAQVTAVGEDADGNPTFEGTCKVKLGPIALVYAGAGSFVERDESARRFVVDAKGRDKRGNGTAGAKVTVTMAAADGGSTQVDVVTDLAITGKPAQFGRGVMQDVSDKLLGQFVTCLEQRLATEAAPEAPVQLPNSSPAEAVDDKNGSGVADQEPPRPAPARPVAAAKKDDALDLGSAVLPVLRQRYGTQAAVAVLAVLALRLLIRTLRR